MTLKLEALLKGLDHLMSEEKSQILTLGVVGTLGQYFVSLSKVCAILCALQAKFSSGGGATGVPCQNQLSLAGRICPLGNLES